ncbi:MAG TPA: carboxymuconolactone decarboxylase family protein, partial [Myxococcales bacterium]
MANASEALDTYLYGYERFRKESGFTPAEQEIVFLTISYENGCEYCMAAHSTIADTRSGVPRAATDAIRAGARIDDPRLRALSEFTRAMLRKRGRPDQEDVDSFLDAGFSEKQILDILLAIAVKTISNYTNHIFDTPLDAPFKSREWKPADSTPRPQPADAKV